MDEAASSPLLPMVFQRSLMQHFWSLDEIRLDNAWLTIGSFDGVHIGHQKVLRELAAGAHQQGMPAVVLTFYPHPAIVLRGHDYPFYLSPPNEKAHLLGELGIDVVITHPFNKAIAATAAQDFMNKLHQHLHIQHLQIGYDFALGKNRDGNFETLSSMGATMGFSVRRTNPLNSDGQVVSSSRIRFLLGAGQVAEAATLLSRNFAIEGKVVLGDQRGASLGFPTANLDIWAEQAIPAAGVYVCRAHFGSQTWGAVTNIGVRPTFESSPVRPRVEAHLLDFAEDIYGESIQLEFIQRLRGEQRFSDVAALILQIGQDSQQARKILAA